MSHISKVECQFSDLDALEIAVGRKNAELRRNVQQFRSYPGTNNRCEHVITILGDSKAYEIGLRREAKADGAWEPALDWFDGKLAKAFGPNLEYLRNEYLSVVAEQQLQKAGYRYTREVNEATHEIQLTASY